MSRWYEHAACSTIGPGPWDTEGGDSADAARAVCHACPVQRACLETAMAAEGPATADRRSGIWGGLGPVQRARLHRERRAAA